MVILTVIVPQSYHRKRQGYVLFNSQINNQTAVLCALHDALQQDTAITLILRCEGFVFCNNAIGQ